MTVHERGGTSQPKPHIATQQLGRNYGGEELPGGKRAFPRCAFNASDKEEEVSAGREPQER